MKNDCVNMPTLQCCQSYWRATQYRHALAKKDVVRFINVI
jgi:hypothetical protein